MRRAIACAWRARCSAALVALALWGCGDGTRDDGGAAAGASPAASTPAPGAASSGPSGPAEHPPWFRDALAESGVDFVHQCGHQKEFLLPEAIGGGVALLDMDLDGDLDLYLVQSGRLEADRAASDLDQPGNRLYRNRGNGTFDDVTAASGAGDRGYGIGVTTGDYDADGDLDLYVSNVGPDVLLRNDGGGRFTDVTAALGLDADGFGASCAFVDVDDDGALDLWVVEYQDGWSVETNAECTNLSGGKDYCSPRWIDRPVADRLFRNRGDGTFVDVSESAGIAAARGNGLGIVCGDFDDDGRVDVFVANDMLSDFLWMNQGDGTFAEEGMMRGCSLDHSGTAKAGMGAIADDVDHDGDLDVMVCNIVRQTDSFFLNEGGMFHDATGTSGFASGTRAYTRWGMAWMDFDHDGALDFYQANGRVNREAQVFGEDPYAEPNTVLRGSLDPLRFQPLQPAGGTAEPLYGSSRGAAFGDINGDGAVDVVVANRDAAPHILVNVVPERGHWLLLRVIDEHGRDAIGARVEVVADGRTRTREVRTAFSYCSANDPRVHVGLGASTRVDRVRVRWVGPTGGAWEAFDPPTIDTVATLRRGEGRAE